MADRWTTEEDSLLQRVYPTSNKSKILLEINKPWLSILRRSRLLGLKRDAHLINEDRKIKGPRKDAWTLEEESLLKEIYEHSSKEDILSKFDRPWSGIRSRALSLNLRRDPSLIKKEMIEGGKNAPKQEDSWSDEEIFAITEGYFNLPREVLLNKLNNRTWPAVRLKAMYLGLKRNPEIIKKENVEYTRKAVEAKYGVKSVFMLSTVKEKIKSTNLTELGVSYPSQSSVVRDKIKETVLNRYGVDNVFKSEDIKTKSKETNILKYGVESPLQNEDIKNKVKNTNIERYGVPNTFQLVDKVQQGMVGKYGEKTPLKIKEFIDKKNETNLKTYGCLYPQTTEEIKNKIIETNIKTYGYNTPLKNDKVKEKIKDTLMERYGEDNPAKVEEFKEKSKETCMKKYGVPYSLQSPEVRSKLYQSYKSNDSFSKSQEEMDFLKYLRILYPNIESHVEHPTYKYIMDYYIRDINMWVQYDGVHWHGKYNLNKDTEHYSHILKTMMNDEHQNSNIPNLVRFWSDEVIDHIKNKTILNYIHEKIEGKLTGKIDVVCHQYKKKMEFYEQDIKDVPFDISVLKASSFSMENTSFSKDIVSFIKKYEWLRNVGTIPKWCFTAKYNGVLGGVVLINEPTAYSKILGENTREYEALIQRGATASWTPKNLGSRLIMFSCRWVVANTDKRAFVCYSDPRANEIGIIYQSCNFDYLGSNFGNNCLFRHPMIKDYSWFSSQSLKRTSVFKKWCQNNNISCERDWFKENKTKDIKSIPEDVLNQWVGWFKKILNESEKKYIDKKHKYALILGRDKKEQKFLNSLKTYTPLPYPKRPSSV